MGSVLVQLLPLVIGSMAMPTWVLLVLALLRRGHTHGQARGAASAFVGGITAVRLAQGLLFGTVFNAADVSHGRGAPGTLTSTLLLVAGILLWVTALAQAYRTYLAYGEDDLDRPFPSLAPLISALTPLRALGLGALLVLTSSRAWLFTLAALGVIGQAELSTVLSGVAFLLYVLGAELLLIVPILLSTRASARFDAAAQWLEQHSRSLVIIVSLVVGSYFVWRGLSGLIG